MIKNLLSELISIPCFQSQPPLDENLPHEAVSQERYIYRPLFVPPLQFFLVVNPSYLFKYRLRLSQNHRGLDGLIFQEFIEFFLQKVGLDLFEDVPLVQQEYFLFIIVLFDLSLFKQGLGLVILFQSGMVENARLVVFLSKFLVLQTLDLLFLHSLHLDVKRVVLGDY